MPRIVETGDDSLRVLGNAGYHHGQRLFAVGVEDKKIFPEVGEDLRKEAAGVGREDGEAALPGRLRDLRLVTQGQAGHDDDPEVVEPQLGQGPLGDAHLHVSVEGDDAFGAGDRSADADAALAQVKLGGEVAEGDGGVVVQRDRAYAGQHHVLGNLYAEPAEAAHEHVGARHAPHGLVPEHVQLPGVEALVNVVSGVHRGVRVAVVRVRHDAACRRHATPLGREVGARAVSARHGRAAPHRDTPHLTAKVESVAPSPFLLNTARTAARTARASFLQITAPADPCAPPLFISTIFFPAVFRALSLFRFFSSVCRSSRVEPAEPTERNVSSIWSQKLPFRTVHRRAGRFESAFGRRKTDRVRFPDV